MKNLTSESERASERALLRDHFTERSTEIGGDPTTPSLIALLIAFVPGRRVASNPAFLPPKAPTRAADFAKFRDDEKRKKREPK